VTVFQAVVTRGGRFLEAPVIGSKQLAKDGQLVVITAGDKSLYDDCQSCLQAMARHMFYLGRWFISVPLFMYNFCYIGVMTVDCNSYMADFVLFI